MLKWLKRKNDFDKRASRKIRKIEKEIIVIEGYLSNLKKNKDALLIGLKEQCPHNAFTQNKGEDKRVCDFCNFSEFPDAQGNYKKLLKGKIFEKMPVFGIKIQYVE